MPLSVVAIVGRPNVGKSSLFNLLAGRQIAIVDPTAGVTRDRVSAFVESGRRWFELQDTGGMGMDDADQLAAEVEDQIARAIDEADLLVMVADVRAGVEPLDKVAAERLRRSGKPVILAANKADVARLDTEAAQFFSLGLGEPVPLSAKQGRGRDALLRRIRDGLPPSDADAPPKKAAMTLAIVGKRNAGKSTFINSLAGEPRVIVSEVPGTTRDSVDIRIEKDDETYVVIDTAGLRKKRKVSGDVEFYGRVRAERAVRRADVTLLLIDAMVPISKVDKHLGRFIVDARKPVVLVVNKWDLAKDKATTGQFADYLSAELTGLDYAPITFLTALEGRNTQAALDVARSLFNQAHTRVSTARINKAVAAAVRHRKPPAGRHGAPLKLYYGTQVAVDPPTLALFVSDLDNVTDEFARYLANRFRETLPFAEVPLRLLFRQSHGKTDEPKTKPRPAAPKRRRKRL